MTRTRSFHIPKDIIPKFTLILITAAAITVTGIIYKQSVLRILPLYISLIIGALQSRANRYAPLLGGFNSILYMIVYLYLGLYASAGYALLFSCPIQLVTFVRWSHRKYGSSTQFRRLSTKQRILVSAAFLLCFVSLLLILRAAGSSHQILDNLSTLLGILISFLTMFACIEYAYLMLPSGIVSIVLNLATMQEHPEQITYLIFSFYSMICVTQGFFRVRKLYREQTAKAAE